MKIKDSIYILNIQKLLKRTPNGRDINDNALSGIEATINDKKNYEINVTKCKNCGIIISSLLVPNGCINCGCKDLDINIINI